MIWSVSASRTFDRCQRQFYFNHIMAWHKTNDPLRKRAHFLGQICQPAWWPGKVVHKIIQRRVLPAIKSGKWANVDQVVFWAQDLVQQQFQFSQAGGFRTMSRPNAGDKFCILAPHYFEEPLESEVFDKTVATVTEALRNLLSSRQMRVFLMGRQFYQWEYRLHFKVEGMTVRAVPDLMMPSASRPGLDVVDWKVAKTASSYHHQVAVYALAALETGLLANYAQAGLTAYIVNLLEPEPATTLENPYKIDEEVLVRSFNTVYESVERIRALTRDKKYDQLDIERFEYARSAGTCAFCNWRKLCMELGDGSPAKSLSNFKSEPTQLELPFG